MKRAKLAALGVAVVAVCAVAALTTGVANHGVASASAAGACELGNKDGQIKHVIYLQFDNVHYRRDDPRVPSDLEQMPHLLNFLKGNGTLLTNDHTILISHTGGGIVSSLTGLYPDREGLTVSNSYDYFQTSGTDKNGNALVGVPKNTTAFKYWTDTVDGPNETLPNMVGDGGQTAPAPWLTYTHAGCNVGGVSAANIELENANTSPSGDITRVFGNPSPEFAETTSNQHKAQTDFVGIAVHCALDSLLCKTADAKPDDSTTVPGSNDGYLGLFGAKYVNPQIGGHGADHGCISAEDGSDITDPAGNCGFPGFDGALAKNTLGEVEAMQEHGVQVTYAYLSDVHDFHVPDPAGDTFRSSARGPGEIDYENQLKDYDKAFESFFANLAAHGIDKSNTLFVVTVDEGDHFTGGTGTPDPANAGAFVYSHTNCTDLSNCPSNQMGEVNINLPAFLPTGEPTYDIHFDDAPTFYVKGQPERTNPSVRKLEQDLGGLSLPDPYASSGTARAVFQLADPVEEQTLHMINSDPLRTPTFTMFGNDDFFFTLSQNCGGFDACAAPGFAWNHGDSQEAIGNTWAGYVGPGSRRTAWCPMCGPITPTCARRSTRFSGCTTTTWTTGVS